MVKKVYNNFIPKEDKGITLIALVVTIIVLLILAGVTIYMVFGEQGIIAKAGFAANEYKRASEDEGKSLESFLNQMNDVIEEEKPDVDPSEYDDLDPIISLGKIEDTTVVSAGGNVKEINNDVPIPHGFYYVGGTKNTGVVISSAVEDENKGDSHEVAQTLIGNQFVWVPVKQYSKIQVTITHGNSKEKVRKWAVGVIYDEGYFTSNGTEFTGNTISIADGMPVGGYYTVYTESKNGKKAVQWIHIDTMYDKENQVGQLYNFSSGRTSSPRSYWTGGYREPAYLTDITYGDASLGNNVGVTQELLQTEFNNMIASTTKYRGFYIGRYETGNLNGTAVVKAGNTDIGNSSWWVAYAKAKAMYESSSNVITSMIWGSQWDQTLRWMNEDESIGNYATDSTGKGNYYEETFQYYSGGSLITKPVNTQTKIPTGSTQISKVYNIYDMAGNVCEWTLEANSTNYRIQRRRLHWFISSIQC